MLIIELLLEALVASIVGLALSGVYITGAALQARYDAISYSQPPTIPAPLGIRPRPPRYTNTCPLALPVQLKYSPLAATTHNEPLVLLGHHGFVPIAPDHLYRVNPITQRDIPGHNPQQVPRITSKITVARTFSNNLLAYLVQALRPEPRTKVILLVLGFCIAATGILALYSKMVAMEFESLEDRRLSRPIVDYDFVSQDLESEFLERTTRKLKAALDRCTNERDRLQRAAGQRDHAEKVVSDLEDLAMGMVEALAMLDPRNEVWEDLLDHGITVPESVVTGIQAQEPPDAATVPVEPPPL